MSTKTYMCPICGFDMDDPPQDYNICSCCSTEFGAPGMDYLHWPYQVCRERWLQSGMKWWSKYNEQPEGWNAMEQFSKVIPLIRREALEAAMRLAVAAEDALKSWDAWQKSVETIIERPLKHIGWPEVEALREAIAAAPIRRLLEEVDRSEETKDDSSK